MEEKFEEIKQDLKEIRSLIKDFKKELRGLIEIQQKLVHERLNVSIPPPPPETTSSSKKEKGGIQLINYSKGRIGVTGDTFVYNDVIKATAAENNEKAKWDASMKAWHLPDKCLTTLIDNFTNLEIDFKNNVKQTKEEEEDDDTFGSGL